MSLELLWLEVRLSIVVIFYSLSRSHSGDDFQAPGFVRVSFAASLEIIDEGLKRFRNFIMDLDTTL